MTLDDQLSFAANIAGTLILTQEVAYGFCHFALRLLQFAPGWCACMCHPTSAAHPERSSRAGLQPTQVLQHYTTPLHNALAMGGCSNLIQDWYLPTMLRMALPPGHGQTIHPSLSTMLCYCQSACYFLTMRGSPATTQQNHDCLLSWLLIGRMSSPLA